MGTLAVRVMFGSEAAATLPRLVNSQDFVSEHIMEPPHPNYITREVKEFVRRATC